MLGKVLLILSAAVVFSNATELPSYIKTCSKSDPYLNECFKNNGNLALQTLQFGDVSLNIAKFEGLKFFDTINIQPLKQLPFSFLIKNCFAFGLDTLRIKETKIDLTNRHMEILYASPQIIWKCEYEAQANILLGQVVRLGGSHNITFNNGEYLYKMDYNLKDVNGQQYIDITSHSADFITVDVLHSLENIASNTLLNGFWLQIKPYFITPELKQPCGGLVTRVLNAFFNVFSYNQLFRP